MIKLLYGKSRLVFQPGDRIKGKGLPPGHNADHGIDPSGDREEGVDLFLPASQLCQHAVEFDQVQMEKDPDIFQNESEKIRLTRTAAQEEGRASAERGKSL